MSDRQPTAHASGDSPKVSVIVPVFNGAESLRRCLQALTRQTYDRYEVIVVDNGSDPAEGIAAVMAEFPAAIAAREAQPGSYAARNAGIAIAQGEVLAFTDADCVPAPDWVEQGVLALLSAPDCGFVAGRIDVFFRHPDRATPVELYESLTAFPQRELTEQRGYAATANLFTFRAVVDRVGLFDAKLKSGGDVDWGRRVGALGYPRLYADQVRVAHPARYSFSELHRRTVRLAGGAYDLLNRMAQSAGDRQRLYALKLLENLVPPVNFVVRVFRSSQIPGFWQKLQVSGVMVFVRYVSAGELIRLKLGGVSARE